MVISMRSLATGSRTCRTILGSHFRHKHQASFSFHTPEEPQLAMSSTMGASLSIGLGYDVNDESGILEGSPSNLCRTKETPANTFQDSQSQSESIQRPHTERESSSPIRTKGISPTAQRGSSRNVTNLDPFPKGEDQSKEERSLIWWKEWRRVKQERAELV